MPAPSILIVQEEAAITAGLRAQLLEDGYRVNPIVHSGEDAVRIATEMRPDLVLMEVCLKGSMDGVEAARQIYEKTQIPVVYLTAYPEVFFEDPSRMQLPNLCVLKPCCASELHWIIEAALHINGNMIRSGLPASVLDPMASRS